MAINFRSDRQSALSLPDPVRAKTPATPAYLEKTTGESKIFFSQFISATLQWNESTLKDNVLPFTLLTVQFQSIVSGLRLFVQTIDNGGTVKTPARTDLYLYGGIREIRDPIFAFSYGEYLRTGGGFANLPAPIPISLLCSVDRLQFRVGFRSTAAGGTTAISGNGGAQDEVSRVAAVNSLHQYGIRIHGFEA